MSETKNIVTGLREIVCFRPEFPPLDRKLIAEAADEITHLRTALATASNDALDAADAYLTEQYGLSALGHTVDRARVLSKLKKETPNADT